MTITKQTVADKIAAYLHHEITPVRGQTILLPNYRRRFFVFSIRLPKLIGLCESAQF